MGIAARLRDDYREIFLSDTPLLDVRAPLEFGRGSFPGAKNLPLLDDAEREQVGVCYQAAGNEAAVALGHRLVSGALKQQRLEGWAAFAQAQPHGALYCFRGGQRSQIVQQWLADSGIEVPRISGGYKAMRRFLIESLTQLADSQQLIVVGGRTGTGKTDLIKLFDCCIDLEELAHHRGSGFGRRAAGQPSQIDFEHRLAIVWLKRSAGGLRHLIIEDESRNIGRCFLPPAVWEALSRAPIVLLHEDLANRVQRIRRDYILESLRELEQLHPGHGFEHFREQLLASLDRIEKRLGGVRHRELKALMTAALDAHEISGETELHDAWIERLLTEYYDPMYDYQIEKKSARIVERGEFDAIRDSLALKIRAITEGTVP